MDKENGDYMKVGILTFQTTTNYGACLQCTALTRMINELGVDCETINYRCENIEKRELGTSIFASGILNAPKHIIGNISKGIKARKIKEFILRNCKLSNIVYSKSNISNANTVYDVFISGSDIIWELYVTGQDYTYYLDFVSDDKKKYSYSSSFGYQSIPEEFMANVKHYLGKYQCISVRENEGADIIESLLTKHVNVTVDPTLLFTADFWNALEEPYKIENKKYILLYFDDANHNAMCYAKKLAYENKAQVLFLTDGFRKFDGVKNIMNVSVGQFLWLIHHAMFVVTGSYHGVLFSINYNTPFYYYNRAHQSRINTIISNLQIENRDIACIADNPSEIDWASVNQKLELLRLDSIEYLKRIVSNI